MTRAQTGSLLVPDGESTMANEEKKGTKVTFLDQTGAKSVNAVIADTVTVKRILPNIITKMNLTDLCVFHETQQSAATVALASNFTVRVGVANLDKDSKIRGFVEKPKLEQPVSIGIVVIDGKVMKNLESVFEKSRNVDIMTDLIPYLIKGGKSVSGYLSNAFWVDVGSIEAYEKLDHKFIESSLSYLFT